MNTIRGLLKSLANRENTCSELVSAAIGRITEHTSKGGTAFLHVDVERAMAAAQLQDQMRREGRRISSLSGLPVSIKDSFDVAGQVTTAGSRIFQNNAPAQDDAEAVARLRDAGAAIVGRTNMSEFAFSGLGLNPHYGTPRNPFDDGRVAGGSTSGGAVSVAVDMAVAALGTDTGGSLRIPAAFCGIVGFKPTASRVPGGGVVPLSRTLDSIGVMARTVDCCAILDTVLTGTTHDPIKLPVKGMRFAVTKDVVMERIDERVERVFQRALEKLRVAGAIIDVIPFPELRTLIEKNGQGTIVAAEAWAWHRSLLEKSAEQYDQRVAQRIYRGKSISAADYNGTLELRSDLINASRNRLSEYDAWLMPTVAIDAPDVAVLETSELTFFETNGLVLRNAGIINFIDGCAISLPCQDSGELPVGLSVCGVSGSDIKLLQVSRAIEKIFSPY